MKEIQVKVHYKSLLVRMFFPGHIYGFTLGNHIFFRDTEKDITPRMLNHELIHVCQYADQGVAEFLKSYFWDEKSVAYLDKWSEKEAYANESNMSYIKTRWPNYKVTIE